METRSINNWTEGPTASITPTGSPFTWANPESCKVQVYVSGGTVTGIEVVHNDVSLTSMLGGLLGGQYQLNPGQKIKITYVVAPTMVYHPC